MEPSSPDVQIEYVQHRRRRWRVAGVLVAFAVMIGVLAVFGVAYARQSDQVEELQSQNETILDDHHAIGDAFAEQSKRFAEQSRKLEAAIRSSYGQGFLAGREAVRLPVELRSLARYAGAGVLVPRRIPERIGQGRPRVTRDLDGYTIRWRGLAFFASRTEPLSDWTRQALSGLRRLQLGPYRVQRLTGPSGVIYAWRNGGATYAVIALPTHESAARALIASTR
jgi:nitrogen fixation-related uncharacterized protein